MRSANWVTPNGSASSSGWVRPRRRIVVEVDAELVGQRAERVDDELGLVGVVARRHRRVRREDRARKGRGQRVVERGARRQLAAGQLQRGEGGVALVEVHDGRVDAHRLQRPHRRRRRAAGTGRGAGRASPVYRRELIQRATAPFSGRSASSRKSGTRPTSTRQICATTCSAADGDGDRDRLAVVAGDERHRQALGIGRRPSTRAASPRRRCAGGSSPGGRAGRRRPAGAPGRRPP